MHGFFYVAPIMGVIYPFLRIEYEFFKNTKKYIRIEMKIITLSVIIYIIDKFESNLECNNICY